MSTNCITGKCEEVLKAYPDNHFDAVVTDPPYGLGKEPDPIEVMKSWSSEGYYKAEGGGFMGKSWDAFVPSPLIWKEIYRVLKPGGYLLSFFGTRTYDWGVMSLRFAGFEIHNMVAWVFGSGFPKALDISKAIDQKYCREELEEELGRKPTPEEFKERWKDYRKVVDKRTDGPSSWMLEQKIEHREKGGTGFGYADGSGKEYNITVCKTSEAKKYEGYKTALKPALEPICLARKPISEKNIAENVLKWGTCGLNIDGCRLEKKSGDRTEYGVNGIERKNNNVYGTQYGKIEFDGAQGRFPANLIYDGSDEVLELFPDTNNNYGSVARFFYCAKASKSERNLGLEHFIPKQKIFNGQSAKSSTDMKDVEKRFTTQPSPNNHATVKPINLMRYLCRLITPPNGTILDPFLGSGSTGCGAVLEGFNFVGIEMDEYFVEISKARIDYVKENGLTKAKKIKKGTKKKDKRTSTLDSFIDDKDKK